MSNSKKQSRNDLRKFYTEDYRIGLLVWGDIGCFSAPYTNPNNISYPVVTPTAALGILSSIYWKPEVKWEIEEIAVLNRIEMGQAYGFKEINITGKRGIFSRTPLVDVKYLITFKGKLTDKSPVSNDNNMDKHCQIFCRRAVKEVSFRPVCLGMTEFPASFTVVETSKWDQTKSDSFYAETPSLELGVMPVEYTYANVDPTETHKEVNIVDRIFRNAILRNGVVCFEEPSC